MLFLYNLRTICLLGPWDNEEENWMGCRCWQYSSWLGTRGRSGFCGCYTHLRNSLIPCQSDSELNLVQLSCREFSLMHMHGGKNNHQVNDGSQTALSLDCFGKMKPLREEAASLFVSIIGPSGYLVSYSKLYLVVMISLKKARVVPAQYFLIVL